MEPDGHTNRETPIGRPQNRNLKRGGQPGRTKGVPNKATRAIMEIAQGIFDEQWVASANRRIRAGRAPQLEVTLLHYAFGKPKDHLEHSGAGGGPIVLKVIYDLERSRA